MRVRVKICGITRAEDAQRATELGADAVGMVFWNGSPRVLDLARAASIRQCIAPFVATVALFVNPDANEVRRVLDAVAPQWLQFHGDEEPSFCAQFGRPYLKAVKMRSGMDIAAEFSRYRDAGAMLLDSYDPIRVGGTGKVFDWSLFPGIERRPLVLAGGLDANNVAKAISRLRPFAVDVSSGVESRPGVKDPAKMERFMKAVAAANAELASAGKTP